MDRTFAYPSQQPTDTLWLSSEKNKMLALGYLIQGAFGTSTVVDGLTCSPTSPASLAVTISNGSIYQQEPVDSTNYGTLSADVTHQIIKQGIAQDIPNITLTPPGTSGQAINYLIQAQFSEIDTGLTVLPYFNLTSLLQALTTGIPPIPLSGPSGSGTSQPTIRQGTINIVAKAGAAATAGSQVTPNPDAGYVGLWAVTVANGATQLTSSQIAQYPSAPFISVKLPQVPAYIQGGTWEWGATDTGTANQVIINLTPAPGTITAGFEAKFQKIGTQSNGAMTIIVNGASPVALTNADGSSMSTTAFMPANYLAVVTFNGTSWRWTNSNISTSVGSLNAAAGEGIAVTPSGANAIVAINYPGLSVEPNIALTDLWSFYSQLDVHHRVVSSAQLLAWLRLNLPIQVLTAPQTYYVNSNTGSDSNNGLTPSTPFLTIQKAINVAQTFNLNGFNITINVANGTYTPFVSGPVNGAGFIFIIGNLNTPSAVIINSAAGEAIHIQHDGYIILGFRLLAPADGTLGRLGICLRVTSARLNTAYLEFGPSLRTHILVESTGTVATLGGSTMTLLGLTGFPSPFVTVNGVAPSHLTVSQGSSANILGTILNISGTLSFTSGFWNSQAGYITFPYSTINNTAVFTGTSLRWFIDLNGVINTQGSGLNYLPGNSPGIYGPNRGGAVYA